MNQKEKARELVERFEKFYVLNHQEAKQCALICCDEIIKALEDNHDYTKCYIEFVYWQEVKKEIEKL